MTGPMMEKPWGGSWQWCFCFEEGPVGLFRRVNQDTLGKQQELLTIAELLQTVGGIEVPLDPNRTVAQTEVFIESFFQDLEILRIVRTLEPAAPGVHIYSLGLDLNAEAAFALEAPSRPSNTNGPGQGLTEASGVGP